MDFKNLTKSVIKGYFIILAGINFAIAVFTTIFSPDAQGSYHIFWIAMLLALLMTLPTYIYYSKKELCPKNLLMRKIIHIIILLGILLTCGYLADWIDFSSFIEVAVYVLLFFVIFAVVSFITMKQDINLAKKLNASLKTYKDKNKDKDNKDKCKDKNKCERE